MKVIFRRYRSLRFWSRKRYVYLESISLCRVLEFVTIRTKYKAVSKQLASPTDRSLNPGPDGPNVFRGNVQTAGVSTCRIRRPCAQLINNRLASGGVFFSGLLRSGSFFCSIPTSPYNAMATLCFFFGGRCLELIGAMAGATTPCIKRGTTTTNSCSRWPHTRGSRSYESAPCSQRRPSYLVCWRARRFRDVRNRMCLPSSCINSPMLVEVAMYKGRRIWTCESTLALDTK